MEAIRSFGEVGCRTLSSLILNEESVNSFCESNITQYAFSALAAGVVLYEVRRAYIAYTHQDLLSAARDGNLRAVRTELAKGVGVDTVDPLTGDTALHRALDNGHVGVARALIAAGADVKKVNSKQETPLHVACRSPRPEAVALILGQTNADGTCKVDVNARDQDGTTPLMGAAARGYGRNVEELFKMQGLNLDAQNNKKETALHLAASEHGHVVEQLLKMLASPDIEDEHKQLPLHRASANENVEGLKALVAATKDCNHKDQDGKTALHLTVHHITPRMGSAEVLLKSPKVNPDVMDNQGETALHEACATRIIEDQRLALAMIESGRFNLDLQTENADKDTAAHIAAGIGADRILDALIKKRANFNIPNGKGESLIRVALERRKIAVIAKLIEPLSKEDLDQFELEGLPLIEWVTIFCDPTVEEVLNSKGIYFTFTAQNRDRILKKAEELFVKKNQNGFLPLPIKIKELREFVEDLQNPGGPSKQPEMVGLYRQGLASSFERRAIVAVAKQKGTHVPLAELFFATPFDMAWYILSLIPIFPEAIRQRIQMILEKGESGPTPEQLAAIKAQIPPEFRYLLDREFSIDELKQHLPMVQAVIKLNESKILQALQQLPI